MQKDRRKELEEKVQLGTITIEEYREVIDDLRGKRKEYLSKATKKKLDTKTQDIFAKGE